MTVNKTNQAQTYILFLAKWNVYEGLQPSRQYTHQDSFCVKKYFIPDSDQLRVCGSQPEGIGQSSSVASFTESSLEIPLAIYKLSNEGLTRRHVSVVFNPGTTDDMELSRCNLFLDLP